MRKSNFYFIFFATFSLLLCRNVLAADLEITSPVAEAGKDLTFTFSVNNAPNAVYAFGFDVSYDESVLQYKSYSNTGFLTENFEYFEVNPFSTGNIRIGGMDEGSNIILQNFTGILLTLTFEVLDIRKNTQVSIQNKLDDMAAWTMANKDSYEPDNFYTQSGVIDNLQYHNFHEAGDADWGMIYGTSGKSYTLKITNPEVNCDAVIELYGIDGQTLIMSENDNGAGAGESITWSCLQDTIYFAKIRNNNSGVFGSGTGYELLVEYPAEFDAYEPDNTPAQARDIIVDFRPQTHGFLTQGDEDWVQFNAVAGENYTVEMNPLESCDIAVGLYGTVTAYARTSSESLSLLKSENNAGPGETEIFNWQCSEGGKYYLKFYRYSLTSARSGQMICEYNAKISTQGISYPGFISGNVKSDGGPLQNVKVEILCNNLDECNKTKCNILTNAAGNYQFSSLMGIYTLQSITEGGLVSYYNGEGMSVDNQVSFSDDSEGVVINIQKDCSGDINGDQDITAADALIVFDTYFEKQPTTYGFDPYTICYDVNKDGYCTPADSSCIFQKYMGKPSCLD